MSFSFTFNGSASRSRGGSRGNRRPCLQSRCFTLRPSWTWMFICFKVAGSNYFSYVHFVRLDAKEILSRGKNDSGAQLSGQYTDLRGVHGLSERQQRIGCRCNEVADGYSLAAQRRWKQCLHKLQSMNVYHDICTLSTRIVDVLTSTMQFLVLMPNIRVTPTCVHSLQITNLENKLEW